MESGVVLLDLDNTLVDRTAAIARWTNLAAAAFGRQVAEALLDLDGDGFVPRSEFFAAAAPILGCSPEQMRELYLAEYPRQFVLEPVVARALRGLRAAGHALVIVTNGPPFQNDVIAHVGLDQLVDARLVSDVVGARKPAASLVAMAVEAVGRSATDARVMVGDSDADVQLGVNAGIASIYLRRGRVDHRDATHSVDSFSEAAALILAS